MTHRFFLLRKRWLSLLSRMNLNLQSCHSIYSLLILMLANYFSGFHLAFQITQNKKILLFSSIFSPTFHPCFMKINHLLLWHITGMKNMWPSTEQCLWSIVRSWMSEYHKMGINGKGAENAVKLQKLKLVLLPVKQLNLCIVQHV